MRGLRLSEPTGRDIDKRIAADIGVDERYSGGLVLGPGGKWAECEGALEANQGHNEEANYEKGQTAVGAAE